jgi:hypothetical protein
MTTGMARLRWLGLVLAVAACRDGAIAAPSNVVTPPPLAECHWLGVVAPQTLPVGQAAVVSAFREFCRPNFFPLTNDQVVWSSVTPAIASVANGIVTAHASGAAVVGVAYGQITQQVLIVVGGQPISPPATAQGLTIYGSPSMSVGQRGSFGAYVVTTDGAVAPVTSVASWRSSNPQVLGESGIAGAFRDRTFDAHAAGGAAVTVTYGGATATMAVEVR